MFIWRKSKWFFLIFAFSSFLFWTFREFPKTQSFWHDEEVQTVDFSAGYWNSPDQAQKDIVRSLQSDPTELFQLLNAELKEFFSQEDFEEMLSLWQNSVVQVELLKEAEETAEGWAEFTVHVVLDSGDSSDFLVILVQEAEGWKIFGTQEV